MENNLDVLLDMLVALPDPVFLLTESGRYAAIIGGQDRKHYHDGAHLVDFSLYDVLPKEKADWFLAQIKLTLDVGSLQVVEYGLAGSDVQGLDTGDGPEGEIWFEGRIHPIANLVNGERAVVWLAANITRRHQLEYRLHRLSETDELTGAYNRRKLFEELRRVFGAYRRYQTPACFILFDIDHFKAINDSYGHINGDKVLRDLVALSKEQLRETDIFARFGGEEFAILLPNTNLPQALQLAERLRAQLEAYSFLPENPQPPKVTISLGVSEFLLLDDEIESIVRRADEALYAAKDAGRNCVQIKTEQIA